MSTMKMVYNFIIVVSFTTLVLISTVNSISYRGREVVKAFSACANDTLENIIKSKGCKFEVWENKMKEGPRKNVPIRYYALENNSCMALRIDKKFNVNIVRVVASAFLMPNFQSRCYYNHTVILQYGGNKISMMLHKYSGNRPDEYIYTFEEPTPSKVIYYNIY